MTPAHGNCLCGAIRFTAKLPSRWVAHCHCTMCQQTGGSAFITWVGLEEQRCQIHDPQNQLQWYQSSDEAQRGFCKRCGSTLFFKSSRWPDEIHVALSNFQTPVDKAPQVHAFWDTHVDWVVLNDDLPRRTGQQIFEE
ncbi:MAG: GFA family protein [Arenimonas sp.]